MGVFGRVRSYLRRENKTVGTAIVVGVVLALLGIGLARLADAIGDSGSEDPDKLTVTSRRLPYNQQWEAGGVSWTNAAVFWPGLTRPPTEAGSPPETCENWPSWSPSAGAFDVGSTTVRVDIQSTATAAISISGVDLTFNIERRETPPAGTYGYCENEGGADATVRHMELGLDTDQGEVSFFDDYGEPTKPFEATLAPTESEVIYIVAWTTTCDCTWRGTLEATVDGERQVIRIDDDERGGEPFRTIAGPTEAPTWRYVNGSWAQVPADPNHNPCFFVYASGWVTGGSDADACAR